MDRYDSEEDINWLNLEIIEELNSQGCNIRLIYEEEFLSLIK